MCFVSLLLIFCATLIHRPLRAIETAHVYFHQFYYTHSFSTHGRLVVAITALLLASKTEECPKNVENVSSNGVRIMLLWRRVCANRTIYLTLFLLFSFSSINQRTGDCCVLGRSQTFVGR